MRVKRFWIIRPSLKRLMGLLSQYGGKKISQIADYFLEAPAKWKPKKQSYTLQDFKPVDFCRYDIYHHDQLPPTMVDLSESPVPYSFKDLIKSANSIADTKYLSSIFLEF
jgi:hypothetical protein